MKKRHKVEKLTFQGELLKINIDGQEYRFRLSAISKRLTQASPTERETYIVSPSGYGIHWPLIDEDLSVDGLLGIKHSPPSAKTLTKA